MKTKVNIAIVQGLYFPRHETDIPTMEFVLSKLFFLLTNLFTPSFTLSLQPNHNWISYVKDAFSGLRQSLPTKTPVKMMKNTFYFT